MQAERGNTELIIDKCWILLYDYDVYIYIYIEHMLYTYSIPYWTYKSCQDTYGNVLSPCAPYNLKNIICEHEGPLESEAPQGISEES